MASAWLPLLLGGLNACFPAHAAFAAPAAEAGRGSLSTVAEGSGWKKTGRYSEVVGLCAGFERAYPGKVRCESFGKTPEGRPMLALVASADGALDPGTARERGRPVVMFQGGIHAGEIEGKDAGFLALRDLLTEKEGLAALGRVTVVFVPVFNIDGHERFGPNNRPNQTGPEETGWRTTAQNLNLNRDYTKVDAPEMLAMLEYLGRWDPIAYADLHTTDGAKFRHDISISLNPSAAGPERLAEPGRELRDRIVGRLKSGGHLPLTVYPAFRVDDDPASGIRLGVSTPRFSQCYWGNHNRFGILVEIHSWLPYEARVKADRDFIRALVDEAAARGAVWLEAAAAQDAADRLTKGEDVALTYAATDKSRLIDFLGYAYTRSSSAVSGQLWTVYDDSKPEVWRIPYFDELKPKLVVRPPGGGYVVPAASAQWMRVKLKAHGIGFEELGPGETSAAVSVFRAAAAALARESFEGRGQLSVQGRWAPETRDIPSGSIFVPIHQARMRLILHLLEPEAPDSLLSWGYFNAAFERKEYMEPYVAEGVAREMLARDPGVKADFEKRLREDPAFASSPEQRLEFFYRKHPAWDERMNLYPVYRMERPL